MQRNKRLSWKISLLRQRRQRKRHQGIIVIAAHSRSGREESSPCVNVWDISRSSYAKDGEEEACQKSDEHGVVLLSESIDFWALLELLYSSFRKNPRNKLLLHLNSFLYINFYFISIL